MANNPIYRNPNDPLIEDQEHHSVEGLVDPATGGIVARVAANVRTITGPGGKQIKVGDATSSAVAGVVPDTVATGNLTAAQPTVGTVVAGGTVSITLGDGQATVEAQLTGTFSAGTTINFEGTDDSGVTTNWFATFGKDTSVANPPDISSIVGGASKLIRIPSAGYQQIRMRASTLQGGDNVAVRLIASVAGTSSGSLSTNDGTFASHTDATSILTQVTNHTETQGTGAAAGTAWRMEGDYNEQTGFTVNALNGLLIASLDVRNYLWASLHITGTWVGTLTFQGSNTGLSSDWQSVQAIASSSTSSVVISTSGNGLFYIPLGFKDLQVTATAWTSGTANAVLELFTIPPTALLLAVASVQSGTWNVGLNAGVNMIGHTIVDSGQISSFAYDFNGITNDRRRNITGMGVASTNSVTGQSAGGATFGSATGLQPGQSVLLTGGTADEVVVTSTTYTAISTTVLWGTVQPAYTNHTGAIWLIQNGDGPGVTLLPLLETASTYLQVLSETAGRGIALKGDNAGSLFVDPRKEYVQLQSNTYTGVTTTQDGADIAVGPYTELCVNINCSAYSGSGNIVVKVQRKDSFGNYITLGNSSNIAATGGFVMSVGPGLNSNHSLGGTCRVEVNIPTSTPPTATITIDVGGK